MDSYGEVLRKAREAKELDLDRVSRDITIEKQYLQGLEDEENSVFPGEAYLTGFLRNYANYLELDADFILKLYHNKQLQESPVPEGLIERRKVPSILFTVVIPLTVVVIFAVVTLVLILTKKTGSDDEKIIVSNKSSTRQYEVGDKKFVQRVYKGDQLIIPTENGGKIFLTVHDTLSSFGIDTPSGTYYVDLAEESEIDINGDNSTDMILYVSDLSSTDESRGAEISVLLRHGISTARQSVILEDIPFASEIKSKHPQKVILEDNRAYPFTVNASFRGSCLFRDKVDRNNSIESYFERGELFTATPQNGIRLWISNSNALKITIIADARTFDLEIGSAGQVLVEDIKWIKDTDGKYKLVVIELD